MEVFEILQCDQGANCLNSLEHLSPGSAKCGVCRFAPNAVRYDPSFWKPRDGKSKHPAAVAAKKKKSKDRVLELRTKRRAVNPAKRRVLVLAERAERQTERNVIHATKNSGRSNRDGDHVMAGQVTVDTKLQSKRVEPVVHLYELNKVREDAKRAGNWLGCLTLRNKHGVGVVVLAEEDWARLLTQIQ